MSEDILKNQLVQFGNRLKPLAILNGISSINLISMLSPFMVFIPYPYYGYPSYNGLLILTIGASILSGIALFINYIYMFKPLGNIGRINQVYNNVSLRSFHSNMRGGIILNLLGMIGTFAGTIMTLILSFTPYPYWGMYNSYYYTISMLSMLLQFFIIGVVIGRIMEAVAWKNLEEFFRSNVVLFPSNIGQDATMAVKKLKLGSILVIFTSSIGIISVFGIVGILGTVFYIIGFNTLNRTLRKLESPRISLRGEPRDVFQPMLDQTSYTPPQQPVKILPDQKFCGNCGTLIELGAQYCISCGSKL